MARELEIEYVDPIEIGTGVWSWTCSLCCVMVREDYMEAHRQWHQ